MHRFQDFNPYGFRPAELNAAGSIVRAAEALQAVLSDEDEAGSLPAQTREMLTRLYRGLHMVVVHYYGDEHGLVWQAPPPGTPFTKVRK